uniref:Solute carrier organic anion transporter family member 6A1 n=1 Tax=Rousettus aegyptiacus TaxID=9407 RepID=A0A7J8F443_ROUAE|nr:solute carrier organic anion transporter family member 6A1 [Rousettus aegyptiacus]
MQAALRGVEPQASQAQRRESAVPGEAKKARKKLQYMRMSPANLVTLRSLLKKKRNKSAIAKRSGEQSKNSNEVSGLDCVVIPNCQRFNNINCFLIFFCILTIAQGIAFGLVDLSIDTFRRDSSLNVIASMLLSLVYDISSCLIAVFIAYYGGRGNKLKWITVSSILIGFGSLLFAFPYLGNENYRSYGETEGFADASGIIGYALGYAIGAPLIKTFEDIIFDARTGQSGNLTAPCNSHCGCSPSFYSTVCGRDDVEYFSPCFAGCTHSKKLENNQKTYFNCSCINEGLITPDDQGDFIDARSGICNAKCSKLPLFLVLTFCAIVFADFADVPNLLTILRVVSDKQRCLALGVTYVILRLFGSIPGPIAFKIIGETSCTFRDTGHCGIKGSCWIYDTTKMAYLFVGICSFCKVFTIIFTAIGFGLYTYLLKENSDILPVPAKNLKIEKKKNMNL